MEKEESGAAGTKQEMMDLTFKTEHGRFNYRVGAIISHAGRFLLVRNPEAPYLYFVGGRVHFDETADEAVVRETEEETGIRLEIDRPLFFMEQFYDEEVTREHFHEISVYYLMKDSRELERLNCTSVTEHGISEETVWIPEDQIWNCHIVPESIAEKLTALPENLTRIIEIENR